MRSGSMWPLAAASLVIVGVLTLTVYALNTQSPQTELAEQPVSQPDHPKSTLNEAVQVREFIKQKNIYLSDAEVNLLTMAFINSSKANGVDLWLLLSVAASESHFRAEAVSGAGCIGIMQIKPSTAHSVGIDPDSLYNPQKNIEAGTRYLRRLLDKYADESLAVAAYNAGPSRVKTSVPAIRETRQYVQKVSAKRSELAALANPTPVMVLD